MIIARLVHDDPEFAADIVLKIVFVAVKMVFRDISEYGHIRSECFNIVQLKTADLSYVQLLWVYGDLPCKRIADITHHRTVQTRRLADMISQCRGGCLSVAAGNGDGSAVSSKPVSQFYFTDDPD